MKTRIFTTAAMFLLVTSLVKGTTPQNEKDSTTVLALANIEKNQSESFSGLSANSKVESNAFILENWIAGRETWEQEGAGYTSETGMVGQVNLEEWVSGRETWEQESDTYNTYISETVSLDEWITGRENWEREGSGEEMHSLAAGRDILIKWIAERENWEKK